MARTPECTASQSLKATKWGKGWFTFFLPAHNQSRVSVEPGMRIGIRLGPLGGVKAGGASHSPPSARAPAGGGCGNEQPDKLMAIGMPSAAQLGREDEEALSGLGWRSSGKRYCADGGQRCAVPGVGAVCRSAGARQGAD